jgi:hypothetical protein
MKRWLKDSAFMRFRSVSMGGKRAMNPFEGKGPSKKP